MWVKKRHTIAYTIMRFPFRVVLRLLYGYSAKKHRLPKGPHLILSNHQTTMDPFMMALSFKRAIYFMASKDLFTKKPYSRLMKFLVAPIPKSKSESDMTAIKGCLQIAKEGGTVALFPEGNRTFSGRLWPIDPSIVKLIRKLNIPVVLYNLKGGYGIEARWSNHLSKGRMYGEVVDVMPVEQIASLSNEALLEYIIRHLDVIEAPSLVPFHSKRRAERLERILYVCPNCYSLASIYTDQQHIYCHHCDLKVEYTPYLTFEGNIKFHTVYDWYQFQESYIYDLRIDKNFSFEDNPVTLYEVVHGKKRITHIEGSVTMDTKQLVFSNPTQNIMFAVDDIRTVTVVGKHKNDFYVGTKTYQIIGNESYNPLKYWHLYYKIKGEKL